MGVHIAYTPTASKKFNLKGNGINCVKYDNANPITHVTNKMFNNILIFSINVIYEKIFNIQNKRGVFNSPHIMPINDNIL